MYMPFNAPVGSGGQAEPFQPTVMPSTLSFDAGGNPLPLQSNPSGASLPANPWTAAATSAGGVASLLSSGSASAAASGSTGGASLALTGAPSGASGGVPVVLPWVDYGGDAAGGSQGLTWQGGKMQGGWGGSGYGGAGWGGGSNFGEPPWSDALAGGGCGCKKAASGLSPWLILGIVVLGLVMVFGNED